MDGALLTGTRSPGFAQVLGTQEWERAKSAWEPSVAGGQLLLPVFAGSLPKSSLRTVAANSSTVSVPAGVDVLSCRTQTIRRCSL